MFRRVVDFHSLPDSMALFLPEIFDKRLFLVGVQVIPDQVNRLGFRICLKAGNNGWRCPGSI